MKTLFISGIDTDIGKTIITTALACALSAIGKKVAVFKPIQTGATKKVENNWISPDLEFVQKYCPEAITQYSYCFELPATPALAAKEAGIIISFEKIKADYKAISKEVDIVLVEGAGGLFVPICSGKTIADLIKFLNIPTLLVSANQLGTINQTCLSAFYAKSLGINLSGFLFSGKDQARHTQESVMQSNANFIIEYSGIPFLGNFPNCSADKSFDKQAFIEAIKETDLLSLFSRS